MSTRRDGYATREYAHTQPHTALLSTAELLGIDASSILAWLGILRNKNKHANITEKDARARLREIDSPRSVAGSAFASLMKEDFLTTALECATSVKGHGQ